MKVDGSPVAAHPTHSVSWEELEQFPRWLAWKQELKANSNPPAYNKVPYTRGHRKADATSPGHWGTFAEAERWFEEIEGDGVGFALGIDERTGVGFFGVDFDACRDRLLNAMDLGVLEIIRNLGTYAEISPSGGGDHVLGLYDPADLERLRPMLSGQEPRWSRTFKRGGGKHPPAIEVYFGARYFTVTRNHLESTPPELRPVPLVTLTRLLTEWGPGFVGKVAQPSGRQGAQPTRPRGRQDFSPSGAGFILALAMRKKGKEYRELRESLPDHDDPEIRQWFINHKDQRGEREFTHTWERAGAVLARGGPKEEWESELLTNANGHPQANLHNLMLILHNDAEWAGLFAQNSENYQVCATRPPPVPEGFTPEDSARFPRPVTDNDASCVIVSMDRRRLKFPENVVHRAISAEAAQNPYAPIGDYLRGVASQHDLDDDLMNAFHYVFGAERTELNRMIFQNLVVAAVRRKLGQEPYKFDSCTVLYGPQGILKSGFCERLFGLNNFTDNIEQDLSNKDARAQVSVFWCVEFAEVEMLERSNPGAVKAFITSTTDFYRPAYGRGNVTVTRRSVLVGSTNDASFLRDQTGNRRYPTVVCPGVRATNIGWLEENRDRIWAHAYHLAMEPSVKTYFEPGDPLWIEVTDVQKGFTRENIWEEKVAIHVCGVTTMESDFSLITLMNRMGLTLSEQNRFSQAIANALKKLGYMSEQIKGRKRWFAPGAMLPKSCKIVPMKEGYLPPSSTPLDQMPERTGDERGAQGPPGVSY